MSNPITDKTQEAFERWHCKQASCCSTCEEHCIHKPWEEAAYSGGRADLLTELRQMDDAVTQGLRRFLKNYYEHGTLLGREAATDLTTLLDTVKALRLRIAELEAKEEPHGR